MTTQSLVKHEILDHLIALAPTIQEAIPFGAMIGVTDTEKFLSYLPAQDLNLGDIVGMTVPKGDAIYEAIKTKNTQLVTVPRAAFGIPFIAKGVPIRDEKGNVIGGLGIGISLERQEKLSEMAQQFTTTTDEIAASTEELSSSAQELSKFMESLNASQQEMIEQVSKTEKMLTLISSIGRNSRILGLNAGIEAARSGEHGLGFGVVAKEITKLADISATSVDEIQNLLELLRGKVEDVAEAVYQTTEITHEQFAATQKISSALNHLTAAAEDINKLAKEM